MPLPSPYARAFGCRILVERRGVSELYAAMLMIGVTLLVGAVVVLSATNQFGLVANAESVGASIQRSASGVQVALVYAEVASSKSCPSYQGINEGTTLSISLYNFGSTQFNPSIIAVNATAYSGSFPTIGPQGIGYYSVGLGSCAHSGGQTIVAIDPTGDELQFGS